MEQMGVNIRQLNKRAILPMWLPDCLKQPSTHLHTHLQGHKALLSSLFLAPISLACLSPTPGLVLSPMESLLSSGLPNSPAENF